MGRMRKSYAENFKRKVAIEAIRRNGSSASSTARTARKSGISSRSSMTYPRSGTFLQSSTARQCLRLT